MEVGEPGKAGPYRVPAGQFVVTGVLLEVTLATGRALIKSAFMPPGVAIP